jgi:hypothetical protein
VHFIGLCCIIELQCKVQKQYLIPTRCTKFLFINYCYTFWPQFLPLVRELKHVGVIINSNIVLQVGTKIYICNIVTQKMYSIRLYIFNFFIFCCICVCVCVYIYIYIYIYKYIFRTEGNKMDTGATQRFILHVSVQN